MMKESLKLILHVVVIGRWSGEAVNVPTFPPLPTGLPCTGPFIGRQVLVRRVPPLHARKASSRRNGRRSRRNKPHVDKETASNDGGEVSVEAASVPTRPSSTRKLVISLDRTTGSPPPASSSAGGFVPPLVVCAVEIDDRAWWADGRNSENPYGGRIWPSSLGVARFIARLLGGRRRRDDVDDPTPSSSSPQVVLELGCGTGLVSIVAASCGATAVASDVSPLCLSLTMEGWRETTSRRDDATRRRRHRGKEEPGGDDGNSSGGTLSTVPFDLCSSQPLPLAMPPPAVVRNASSSEEPRRPPSPPPRPIVIATAMMYEGDLAVALARRAAEACHLGAWVIVGDDETGEREGGRERFESELVRLLLPQQQPAATTRRQQSGPSAPCRVWIETIVRHKELGWSEKRVKLLHLNPPPEYVSFVSSQHVRAECSP